MQTFLGDENDHLLQIIEAINDMILVKGPGSKILWANRAFREFYGMSNEQLKLIVDAKFNNPDYTQQYVRDDAWVFENGKVLDIPEEKVTRHDGVVRIFHTVKSPIFDTHGRVKMLVGISRDLTDQISVKKAAELQRAQLAHAARMVIIGELAGGIAHEINTPLATIQLLSNQIGESLLEEKMDIELLKKRVERIETTVERIAKIVIGIKNLGRDGTNEPRVMADLIELIQEALNFCSERATKRGIELHIKSEKPRVPVVCRPTQIAQVILNLLNNAMDASSEAKDKWIEIEVVAKDQNAILNISNGGPPIPMELRERIFDPYFTTKARGQGTGLGLSVSRGIVESHGGTLILSEEQKTKFIVMLPLGSNSN